MKNISKNVASPITWIYLGIVALLVIVDPQVVFEPPWLLPITNGLFVAGAGLIIAVFAVRNFLRTGSFSILMMGCGNLAFAAAAVIAGFAVGAYGPNANVTIYNCGALAGAVFHLIGALNPPLQSTPLSGHTHSSRMRKVLFAYLFVLAVDFVLGLATVMNWLPVFFVQGEGPTWLRQLVLGSAIGVFATAAMLFMRDPRLQDSAFIFWYARGLLLIAAGLFAFFMQSLVGSPLGWSGRIGNYLGSVFLIVSLLSIRAEAQASGFSFEKGVDQLFAEPRRFYQKRSIRSWLLLLVLATALPLFALLVWQQIIAVGEKRDAAYAQVKQLADTTAARLKRVLDGNEALLARLAARPLVRALDPQRCDPLIKEYLELHPEFTQIAVRDLAGNIVCSYLVNPVRQYGIEEYPWFYEGLRSGKFFVSDAVPGPRSRRWAIGMTYPLQDVQGKTSGALVMGLDILKLNQSLLSGVPKGVVIAVQDRHDIFLLRSIDPEKWIGTRPLRPSHSFYLPRDNKGLP